VVDEERMLLELAGLGEARGIRSTTDMFTAAAAAWICSEMGSSGGVDGVNKVRPGGGFSCNSADLILQYATVAKPLSSWMTVSVSVLFHHRQNLSEK
jgi:hypothetical protein